MCTNCVGGSEACEPCKIHASQASKDLKCFCIVIGFSVLIQVLVSVELGLNSTNKLPNYMLVQTPLGYIIIKHRAAGPPRASMGPVWDRCNLGPGDRSTRPRAPEFFTLL